MKYFLTILAIITLSLTLIWFELGSDSSSQATPDASTGEVINHLNRAPGFDEIDLTKTGIYRPETVVTRNSATWLETDASIEAPQVRADVPDLKLYGVDRSKFTNLTVGDSVVLTLPAPLSDTVQVWVDQVIKNTSGSTTINGKVNGHRDYSFVMTLGPDSTFATIGTSSGVYNLRGNKSHVWVGLGRSYNHHVNPETPDYRIIQPKEPMETNS